MGDAAANPLGLSLTYGASMRSLLTARGPHPTIAKVPLGAPPFGKGALASARQFPRMAAGLDSRR